MRVGINLTQFVPGKSGGVQIYAETLVRSLVRFEGRHRYVLFVNYLTAPLFEDLRDACELVMVDVHIPRWVKLLERIRPGPVFLAYARGLKRLMDRAQVEVLHFPMSFIVPFDYRGRTVLTFLDLQHVHHPEFFSRAEIRWRERHYRPSAAKATHVIAISAFTARSLVERYGVAPDKVSVVHLVAGDDVRVPLPDGQADGLDLPERFFWYPAALWPHKNHARLLQAVAQLRERRGFDGVLVLTGMDAADAGPVRVEIARLGLERQVRMLGYVTRAQFNAMLRRAEFMIFPSLFEGFGIPVAEALAVGCPVACSRTTSLPEVVGDEGLTFDPESVDELAEVIERLWSDPALRQRLRERLAPRAELFTSQRLARETAAVYDRVGSGR